MDGRSIPLSQAEERGDVFPAVQVALSPDRDQARAALAEIAKVWRNGYGGIIWDLLRFFEPPQQPDLFVLTAPTERTPFPSGRRESLPTQVCRRLMTFLEDQTGERFSNDLRRAQRWIWEQPYDPHPDYAVFKGALCGEIDPGMRDLFKPGTKSTIRLHEIKWGGVERVNGIPPLEYPDHQGAAEAEHLDDDHVVFGIAVNGEARAYPKRILAWHEMAVDTIGGVERTIVYCVLCGTVIPYERVVDGRPSLSAPASDSVIREGRRRLLTVAGRTGSGTCG